MDLLVNDTGHGLVLGFRSCEESPFLFPFVSDHHAIWCKEWLILLRVHPLVRGVIDIAVFGPAKAQNAAIHVNDLIFRCAGSGRSVPPTARFDEVVQVCAELIVLSHFVEDVDLIAVPAAVPGHSPGVTLSCIQALPRVLHMVWMGIVGHRKCEELSNIDLVRLKGRLKTKMSLDSTSVLDRHVLTVNVREEELREIEARAAIHTSMRHVCGLSRSKHGNE